MKKYLRIGLSLIFFVALISISYTVYHYSYKKDGAVIVEGQAAECTETAAASLSGNTVNFESPNAPTCETIYYCHTDEAPDPTPQHACVGPVGGCDLVAEDTTSYSFSSPGCGAIQIDCNTGQTNLGDNGWVLIKYPNDCSPPPPPPVCGDGIPGNTPGEECDDGNNNNDDGCDNNCKKPTVCLSTCNPTLGCNGGWVCNNNECRNSQCLTEDDCICPACGDGVVDPGEECDDGNNIDGDGCYSDCTLPETCNDICTVADGCDQGYECVNDVCRNPTCSDEDDCICPFCGDGNVDPGEECDDGNDVDGDGCDSQCRKPRNCNDVCVFDIGCENDYACHSGQCRNDNCPDEADCGCPSCGDGVVDPGEDCDDGNFSNGDGCDSNCRTETTTVTPTAPQTGAGLSLFIAALIAGGLGALGYFGYQKGWWKGLIGK